MLFGGRCPVSRNKWDKLKTWWKKAPIGRGNILTQEVQLEEFLDAINKKCKAAGWNELVMEHIQFLPIQKKKEVWKWVNEIIAGGRKLDEEEAEALGWVLFKGGDIFDHKKPYRMITIMNIGYRILTKILEGRIAHVEREYSLLSDQQGGFKALRQTA